MANHRPHTFVLSGSKPDDPVMLTLYGFPRLHESTAWVRHGTSRFPFALAKRHPDNPVRELEYVYEVGSFSILGMTASRLRAKYNGIKLSGVATLSRVGFDKWLFQQEPKECYGARSVFDALSLLPGMEGWARIRQYKMKLFARRFARERVGRKCYPVLEVVDVRVQLRYRGKGLFTAFLEELEQLAKAEKSAVRFALVINERLAEFLARRGYQTCGRDRMDYFRDFA